MGGHHRPGTIQLVRRFGFGWTTIPFDQFDEFTRIPEELPKVPHTGAHNGLWVFTWTSQSIIVEIVHDPARSSFAPDLRS